MNGDHHPVRRAGGTPRFPIRVSPIQKKQNNKEKFILLVIPLMFRSFGGGFKRNFILQVVDWPGLAVPLRFESLDWLCFFCE